ncbi:MAG: hypothetical protein ACETVX_04495 [bacterium]
MDRAAEKFLAYLAKEKFFSSHTIRSLPGALLSNLCRPNGRESRRSA